jgi:hypothetical protein
MDRTVGIGQGSSDQDASLIQVLRWGLCGHSISTEKCLGAKLH